MKKRRIIKTILKLMKNKNLTEKEAHNTINDLTTANELEIMLTLFLWERKFYTVNELVGGAKAIKENAKPIKLPPGLHLTDICGTGGGTRKKMHHPSTKEMEKRIAILKLLPSMEQTQDTINKILDYIREKDNV